MVRIFFSLFFIFAFTHVTIASDVSKPVLLKEVLIDGKENNPLSAQAIVPASTNGFIIAGGGWKKAWAAKTDIQGVVEWTYTAQSKEPLQYRPFPEFRGAAMLPDGSTFLCGYMPAPKKTAPTDPYVSTALITHVDPQGQLLSEKLIEPENLEPTKVHPLGQFYHCISWLDGILVIGTVQYFYLDANKSSVNKKSYWLIFLDKTGIVKWEKQIPILTRWGGFNITKPRILEDSAIVFSATDNVNTEVVKIDKNGELKGQNKFSGGLHLVESNDPAAPLQLFGDLPMKPENDARAYSLITLDSSLNEVGRIKGLVSGYSNLQTFFAPDLSIVSFGSTINHSGETYTSRVTHVGKDLQNNRYIEFSRDGKPLHDVGFISPATATDSSDEFVGVRRVFTPQNGSSPAFQALALDFIQVK